MQRVSSSRNLGRWSSAEAVLGLCMAVKDRAVSIEVFLSACCASASFSAVFCFHNSKILGCSPVISIWNTVDLERSRFFWVMIRLKPYCATSESWQKYLLVLLKCHCELEKKKEVFLLTVFSNERTDNSDIVRSSVMFLKKSRSENIPYRYLFNGSIFSTKMMWFYFL